MSRYDYAIIGRAKAGWHGEDFAGGSSSGGSFAHYVEHAVDGAVVYDASAAPYDACARLVISGPMLKATLYGAKRFKDYDTLAHMLSPGGLEAGFRVLGERALAGDGLASYSSFDYVGWDVYRRLLETELPAGSVRFGRVTHVPFSALRRVEWEDATNTPEYYAACDLRP